MKLSWIYLILFILLAIALYVDFEKFLRSHQKPTREQIEFIKEPLPYPESLRRVHEVCGQPEPGKLGEWLECKKGVD